MHRWTLEELAVRGPALAWSGIIFCTLAGGVIAQTLARRLLPHRG